MNTQFKINFEVAEIRTLLIEQAKSNDAIPANVDADTLEMRISPRTGVTFVPGEVSDESDQDSDGGSDTPSQ